MTAPRRLTHRCWTVGDDNLWGAPHHDGFEAALADADDPDTVPHQLDEPCWVTAGVDDGVPIWWHLTSLADAQAADEDGAA